VFEDERGFFFESFNHRLFNGLIGRDVQFVQDNHSRSAKYVLRGLHYQIRQAQGKLVRVMMGEVFDVAVDIRRASPTFGQWVGVTLSGQNKRQLWIPEGFAHGFIVAGRGDRRHPGRAAIHHTVLPARAEIYSCHGIPRSPAGCHRERRILRPLASVVERPPPPRSQ
jgi:hypothetical protein